jgi:hypothetical protein
VAAVATGSTRTLGTSVMRCLPIVFAAAAVGGAFAFAPAAGATPECVQINSTTTQCETPGHSQIVTSPPAMNEIPQWWPYSGIAIGAPW